MDFTVSLKKSGDFSRVYKEGRYYVGKYVILYILKDSVSLDLTALGLTASKKVGKSVRRNRLRRLVRENYRLLEGRVITGSSLIFVIRGGVGANPRNIPCFTDIGKDVSGLLARAGILRPV